MAHDAGTTHRRRVVPSSRENARTPDRFVTSELLYGKGRLPLHIPDDWGVALVAKPPMPLVADPAAAVRPVRRWRNSPAASAPPAFVRTAWLVPLCRNVRSQAFATVRTFSGDQSAFGLAFMAARSRCVLAITSRYCIQYRSVRHAGFSLPS